MSFNEGISIDSGRAAGSRGPGLAIGGGAGGILVLILALVFGVNPGDITGGPGGAAPQQGGQGFEHCRTGEDANTYADCRIIATAESLDAVWAEQLVQQTGVAYTQPGLTIFTGQVSTGCGAATSAVGPFYCPPDATTYFDTGFFDVLRNRLGASGGALAEEYVVAHEFGHHLENQLGLLDRAQADPQGPESGSVRVELMADCLAGAWAHYATRAVDPESGQPFLEPLTEADVADALSAAGAVGDDRIQQSTQGQVNPETWTHGSSEQRQRWFLTGYTSGSVDACNTFDAGRL
jgi:predicted metalloprotease